MPIALNLGCGPTLLLCRGRVEDALSGTVVLHCAAVEVMSLCSSAATATVGGIFRPRRKHHVIETSLNQFGFLLSAANDPRAAAAAAGGGGALALCRSGGNTYTYLRCCAARSAAPFGRGWERRSLVVRLLHTRPPLWFCSFSDFLGETALQIGLIVSCRATATTALPPWDGIFPHARCLLCQKR